MFWAWEWLKEGSFWVEGLVFAVEEGECVEVGRLMSLESESQKKGWGYRVAHAGGENCHYWNGVFWAWKCVEWIHWEADMGWAALFFKRLIWAVVRRGR